MGDTDSEKRAAAEEAVAYVKDGMVVGLGTGSTARFAIEKLGEEVRRGTVKGVVCIPTSEDTARRATAAGLVLTDLAAHPIIDVAMDGADEVDPRLDLIKGLGGAMLREKAVARAAKRFVVFVDESKRVTRLGERAPVPVEIRPLDVTALDSSLAGLGALPKLRRTSTGEIYVTDNGNHILDCRFAGGIPDPRQLAAALDREPRVRAHGLFLGMASEVLVGAPSGVIVLRR